MFRRTCFGYFVDLPEFFIQNQLIHSLLLSEVVSPKDNELWIKVNSTKLRFGLAEFCIITGLKCNGDPNKDYESVQSSRLMELYFPSMSKVFKKLLTDCFLEKMWKSDEDALKSAVLYFVHSFLFSITNDDLIIKNDFLLVESGDFETFPWEKVVFNATLESMKDKVRSRREMYRYGCLPLAFQCWFYECCPYTRKNLAYRIGDLVPCILNWKVKKKVTFKRVIEKMTTNHDKKVSGNNFGSEKVMEKNIGIEEVVKKNVDNEISLEQTVDVMEGVVKDSIQDGKSSEGVGDDEAWIEDAEREITAITQQFCDKNTANMGSLVDDFVQLGVEKNIATMQEDRIVVDHDTPKMNPRERKPAGVMKSPFMNTFDSGGTIQVVENKPTKSKKPILTIKYPFQGNVDNPVDFKVLWTVFI
ncbi:hypothetical protein A4A49_07699 [Nicotiana attenuata]|uniref:DUF1985 domain-containing protein n=1 Tax=Nicotiana attenuata TaxID=49451 RepID=A0A314L5V3_NICAT|nr:hypothetical protein A4A49_07699 [Nicotiana attenuata]